MMIYDLNSPFPVAHLDGVPWYKAPRPRRWHRCRAQTDGMPFDRIQRCACGALRGVYCGRWTTWMDKNSRKR